MANLFGEYEIAIDTKGRCLLPALLRKQFDEGTGDKFVINRGFENCLNIYPIAEWNNNVSKVNDLDEYDPEARKFKRLFLNGATPVEIDSADRVLIPKNLQERVNIKKDVILVGLGNKMELWDKDTYYKFMDDNAADYSNLAKAVMAKKKDNQV